MLINDNLLLFPLLLLGWSLDHLMLVKTTWPLYHLRPMCLNLDPGNIPGRVSAHQVCHLTCWEPVVVPPILESKDFELQRGSGKVLWQAELVPVYCGQSAPPQARWCRCVESTLRIQKHGLVRTVMTVLGPQGSDFTGLWSRGCILSCLSFIFESWIGRLKIFHHYGIHFQETKGHLQCVATGGLRMCSL